MYLLQDAGYGWIAVVYFVSFIIVGSFFLLNVMLAVLWGNFADATEVEEMLQPRPRKARARKSSRSVPLSGFVLRIVEDKTFEAVRTALILLNTITISLDKYPTNDELEDTMEMINAVLTIIFLLETLIKLVGLGWVTWAEDPYNRFDAVTVILNTIESGTIFVAGAATAKEKGLTSFSGLRSVRILALFKMGRLVRSLHFQHDFIIVYYVNCLLEL